MKLILLALFVGMAFAAPTPLEDPSGEPVEVIVNGLAEGEALEIGHIVDVKVKEVVDGEVAVASNPLHPFTAQGLAEIAQAEAAAAAEEENVAVIDLPIVLDVPEPVPEIPAIELPEPVAPIVVPDPIVLPEPTAPIVVPEPIVLPEPVAPEVMLPEPIVLPEPVAPEVILPEPIVLPEPVAPEVIVPEPAEEVPAPAPQLNGEIFNDGTISVAVNAPQDPTVYETLSSWVNLLLNYVNSGVQYTQQLI